GVCNATDSPVVDPAYPRINRGERGAVSERPKRTSPTKSTYECANASVGQASTSTRVRTRRGGGGGASASGTNGTCPERERTGETSGTCPQPERIGGSRERRGGGPAPRGPPPGGSARPRRRRRPRGQR